MGSRRIDARYEDPLDVIWCAVAERVGWTLERSAEVFAAWDGAGTLRLARREDFDPDDSLAQLIFHELCHALVEGPAAHTLVDWGLDNRSDADLVREHACHRLQAALALRHGLDQLLAPTTEHRPYYDELPDDPLADDGDPAVAPARQGWERARSGPWAPDLERALAATAAVARSVSGLASPTSLWSRSTGKPAG